MSLGRLASARAMATRCCSPPDSPAGFAGMFVGVEADALEPSTARARCWGGASRLTRAAA